MLSDGLKARAREKKAEEALAQEPPGLHLKQPCAGCPEKPKPRRPRKKRTKKKEQ